jgi:hypothetical protein
MQIIVEKRAEKWVCCYNNDFLNRVISQQPFLFEEFVLEVLQKLGVT